MWMTKIWFSLFLLSKIKKMPSNLEPIYWSIITLCLEVFDHNLSSQYCWVSQEDLDLLFESIFFDLDNILQLFLPQKISKPFYFFVLFWFDYCLVLPAFPTAYCCRFIRQSALSISGGVFGYSYETLLIYGYLISPM